MSHWTQDWPTGSTYTNGSGADVDIVRTSAFNNEAGYLARLQIMKAVPLY